MKKLAALALIGALALGSGVSASAAVKAGSTCTSKNKTTKVGASTYKCTAVGKKLVWKLVGTTSAGSKQPNPTPSPTPSETLDATVYYPLYGDEKKSISLKNLPYRLTALAAYEQIHKILDALPSSSFKPNIQTAPGVLASRVSEQEKGLNAAIKLWAPYFTPAKYDVMYLGSNVNDREWLKNALTALGSPSSYSIAEQIMNGQPENFCTWGNSFNNQTFAQCLGEGYAAVDRQNSPHEFSHSLQQQYHTVGEAFPCWIVEGWASYYGGVLGYATPEDYIATSKMRYRNFLAGWDDNHGGKHGVVDKMFAMGTEDDFIKIMKEVELPHGIACMPIGAGAYMFGGLGTEILVATYGHDAVTKWIIDTGTERDWKATFKKSFGMDVDSFYKVLYPYAHDWAIVSSELLN